MTGNWLHDGVLVTLAWIVAYVRFGAPLYIRQSGPWGVNPWLPWNFWHVNCVLMQRARVKERWRSILVLVVFVLAAIMLLLNVLIPTPAHAQDAGIAGLQADALPVGTPQDVSGYNRNLFQDAWRAFDEPLVQSTNAIANALAARVAPALRAVTALYLLARILMLLFMPGAAGADGGLATVIRQGLRMGIIATIISAPVLSDHVVNPLLNDIPNEFIQVITGVVGDVPLNAGQSFDGLLRKASAAGIHVYDALPSLSWKALGLMIAIAVYWFIVFILVSWFFALVLFVHYSAGLVGSTAAIFIACALTSVTRQWFGGWLNVMVGTIIAKILLAALLVILFKMLTAELDRINGTPVGANEMGQLLGLVGIVGILVLGFLVSLGVGGIAAVISRGAWINIAHFAGMAAGAGAGLSGFHAASSALGNRLAGRTGGGGGSPAPSSGVSHRSMQFAGRAGSGSTYQP